MIEHQCPYSLLQVALPDAPAPHVAHARLAAIHPHSFILESREGPARLARHSFVGFAPTGTVTVDTKGSHVDGPLPQPNTGEHPLDYLRRLHAEHALPRQAAADAPFVGGLVGSLGHDFVRILEPSLGAGDEAWPRLALGLYLDGIVYDHFAGSTTYVSRGPDRSAEVQRALAAPAPSAPLHVEGLQSRTDEAAFTAQVQRAQAAIRAGEAFQIVLSRAYDAAYRGDLGSLYARLRDAAPVPYLFHLRQGDRQLLGASPEMLVRVRGDAAETFPIAGTRPLTGDNERDQAAAEELLQDRKERAEHAMLVDLARNDLARVCRPGSVQVAAYAEVQRFRFVQHLVSHVRGQLRDGQDALSALCAVFPAGTVSGAPKLRALEHIHAIEAAPRGAYAGAVAYWSFSGDLDSAITIRSLSAQGGRLRVQAGAGIVHRSDPAREFQETEDKAATMLVCLRPHMAVQA